MAASYRETVQHSPRVVHIKLVINCDSSESTISK